MTGKVKVKLGPVTHDVRRQGPLREPDEATHTAVIEGTGKETRGTGRPRPTSRRRCVSESARPHPRRGASTDLTITGKAAQFGRGVMQDVAGRIIDQFAGNLAA